MGRPRIFVGTYGKYNSGNAGGKWFQLDDYDDRHDFLKAAEKYHKDERDPELMFLDWENIPDWAIEESYVKEQLWDYIEQLDEDEKEAFEAYADIMLGSDDFENMQDTIERFHEAFNGEHDSMTDFAMELVEDTGYPSDVSGYFDADSYKRDLDASGYYRASIDDCEDDPETYPSGPGVYDESGEHTGYSTISELVDDYFEQGIIDDETIKNRYFDYEKFGRDLELGGDYTLHKGFVFANN